MRVVRGGELVKWGCKMLHFSLVGKTFAVYVKTYLGIRFITLYSTLHDTKVVFTYSIF